MLYDSCPIVRSWALGVVRHHDNREPLPRVLALLEDPADGVRCGALQTACRLAPELKAELGERMLHDKAPIIVAIACSPLREAGDPSHVVQEVLKILLEGRIVSVRYLLRLVQDLDPASLPQALGLASRAPDPKARAEAEAWSESAEHKQA